MAPLKKIITKQLGELLIERGVINQKQLDKALQVQKEKGGLIGEVLVEMGFAKEEDIAHALTAQYGFPYLPLGNYEIDSETARIISENIARQYCLICIDKLGSNITLAMSNPLNTAAIDDIELITGSKVQIFVSTSTDIKRAIDRCYRSK